METLQKLFDFLNAYSLLAKLGMLGCLTLFAGIAVLARRPEKSGTADPHGGPVQGAQGADNGGKPKDDTSATVADLLAQARSHTELKAALVLNMDILANHVNDTSLKCEKIASETEIVLADERFDFLVYTYDVPFGQNGATVWLIDLYDFANPVNWAELDRDWSSVSGIGPAGILSALKARPGFPHPLQFVDDLGEPVSARVNYIQVAGRKAHASQQEINQMRAAQTKVDGANQTRMYRAVFTYDTFQKSIVPGG